MNTGFATWLYKKGSYFKLLKATGGMPSQVKAYQIETIRVAI